MDITGIVLLIITILGSVGLAAAIPLSIQESLAVRSGAKQLRMNRFFTSGLHLLTFFSALLMLVGTTGMNYYTAVNEGMRVSSGPLVVSGLCALLMITVSIFPWYQRSDGSTIPGVRLTGVTLAIVLLLLAGIGMVSASMITS